MPRHHRRSGSVLLGLLWLLCSTAAPAQEGGDLQARILYAFQAEDTNELDSIIQTLTTQIAAGGAGADLRYHLAHAEYRSGLLATGRPHDASAAFAGCIDQLKRVLQDDVNSVEALVLEAACYANAARYARFDGMLDRSRAAERLSAAAKLQPRNPRVVYFEALDQLGAARRGSAEYRQGVAQLQLAAQLFGESSSTRLDVPGWGHAEAYLELGRQLEIQGDVLGARNWIERSLIMAPDFKAAQRQLQGLVRR